MFGSSSLDRTVSEEPAEMSSPSVVRSGTSEDGQGLQQPAHSLSQQRHNLIFESDGESDSDNGPSISEPATSLNLLVSPTSQLRPPALLPAAKAIDGAEVTKRKRFSFYASSDDDDEDTSSTPVSEVPLPLYRRHVLFFQPLSLSLSYHFIHFICQKDLRCQPIEDLE